MDLGNIETGNSYTLKATFIALSTSPTADSSAVTFTVVDPAGTEVSVNSPDATISGPTLTTLSDGRHQSVWTYAHATPTLPGRYTVRARSTAGLVASVSGFFEVPAYTPLASA